MAVNRGKQFEDVVKKAFQKVDGVSIDRLHDQTNGYLGSSNICDFIVYKKPCEYYIECKSVHGASLPLKNITDTQWNGLLEKSYIDGVVAGVLCWWVDKDVTKFLPIQDLEDFKKWGLKSVNYEQTIGTKLDGIKKRVFFEYDMEKFLNYESYKRVGE